MTQQQQPLTPSPNPDPTTYPNQNQPPSQPLPQHQPPGALLHPSPQQPHFQQPHHPHQQPLYQPPPPPPPPPPPTYPQHQTNHSHPPNAATPMPQPQIPPQKLSDNSAHLARAAEYAQPPFYQNDTYGDPPRSGAIYRPGPQPMQSQPVPNQRPPLTPQQQQQHHAYPAPPPPLRQSSSYIPSAAGQYSAPVTYAQQPQQTPSYSYYAPPTTPQQVPLTHYPSYSQQPYYHHQQQQPSLHNQPSSTPMTNISVLPPPPPPPPLHHQPTSSTSMTNISVQHPGLGPQPPLPPPSSYHHHHQQQPSLHHQQSSTPMTNISVQHPGLSHPQPPPPPPPLHHQQSSPAPMTNPLVPPVPLSPYPYQNHAQPARPPPISQLYHQQSLSMQQQQGEIDMNSPPLVYPGQPKLTSDFSRLALAPGSPMGPGMGGYAQGQGKVEGQGIGGLQHQTSLMMNVSNVGNGRVNEHEQSGLQGQGGVMIHSAVVGGSGVNQQVQHQGGLMQTRLNVGNNEQNGVGRYSDGFVHQQSQNTFQHQVSGMQQESSVASGIHGSATHQNGLVQQHSAYQHQASFVQQASSIASGMNVNGSGVEERWRSQTSTVELEISCRGLRDRDIIGVSDPIAVVYKEKSGYSDGNTDDGRVGAEVELALSKQNEQSGNGKLVGGDGSAGKLGRKQTGALSRLNTSTLARLRADNKKRWMEVGKTEALKNNLNPVFATRIRMDYYFGERQAIKIEIWDVDSKKREKIEDRKHDFLGQIVITLGDIVSKGTYCADLEGRAAAENKTVFKGKRQWGKIYVRAHEKRNEDVKWITMKLSGRKLPRKDFGGLVKSDPYFLVNRILEEVSGTEKDSLDSNRKTKSFVHKSEIIKKNSNPDWNGAEFPLSWPKGGDESDVKLEIQVFDHDTLDRDDLIGTVRTTVRDLQMGGNLTLINEKDKKRQRWKKYENSGILLVKEFRTVPMPTFFEYLQGGLRLHFTVAIDFTLSNKDPRNPVSLHHMGENGLNMYTQAIAAVGNVLASYSTDNRFTALGFGAKLPPLNQVSYKFSLMPGAPDPHVLGVEGILDAYRRCLSSVQLGSPTNFTPIISHASEVCRRRPMRQDSQHYDVLLILTDGVISDMEQAIDAIIEASSLPMSIIIVGIGNEDFSDMNFLDSDNKTLASKDGKRKAKRDIVQFLEFNKYLYRTPDQLTAHLLQELPSNVLEFFFRRGVVPNPPQPQV